MIEPGTARELVALILRVEERLSRVLASGWRQANAEAADLQQDADVLAEAGLPALAARVSAVAAAEDAETAVRTIALAASACQLLRGRLLVGEPPDGWLPIRPPRSRKSRGESNGDTILPVARLKVGGQDVWACSWPARSQVVLLEPPLPEPPPAPGAPVDAGDLMARFQRQLARALSSAPDDTPPSHWLRHRIQGTVRWTALYPVGVTGDIAACKMDNAEWQTNTDGAEQQQLRTFRSAVATNKLQDGTALSWSVSGLRVMELDRRDAAACVWLDPSTCAAFLDAADPTTWAIVLMLDSVTVPLAALRPGNGNRKPRLVHLIPGLPSDVLGAPSASFRRT